MKVNDAFYAKRNQTEELHLALCIEHHHRVDANVTGYNKTSSPGAFRTLTGYIEIYDGRTDISIFCQPGAEVNGWL